MTITRWPAATPPARTAWSAVHPEIGTAADSSTVRASGRCAIRFTSTTARSASEPEGAEP